MSLPFGRPRGREVGSAAAGEVDHAAEEQGVHADLEAFLPERGEGDAGVVRRDARRDGDGSEVGDGVLIGAVVVHLPDLFVSAADLDVVDLGLGDARDCRRRDGR